MIISLLCLGAIFWIIDPAEIWSALQTANYTFLLLSVPFGLFVAQIVRGYRWRFMLGSKISFRDTFQIINIGFMFNYLLPLRFR